VLGASCFLINRTQTTLQSHAVDRIYEIETVTFLQPPLSAPPPIKASYERLFVLPKSQTKTDRSKFKNALLALLECVTSIIYY